MLESISATSLPQWPLYLDDTSIPQLPPPASSRGHARSRTAIDIPPLLSRSPSHSPTRSNTFLPFFNSRSPSPKQTPSAEFPIDPISEESLQKRTRSGKVDKLTSWFEGHSEPVNIGLVASPKQEVEQPTLYNPDGTSTAILESQSSLGSFSPPVRPAMAPANSSRFSFFRKTSTTVQPRSRVDDFVNLSTKDILFPDGPSDEFSPAAFKNLQQNAEFVLRLFQTSYKENLTTLRKVVSEKNVQADELEASNTRNEHLKMQLLEMAERAAEQEKLIASLQAEVEQRKANETALRSIRVVADHTSMSDSAASEEDTYQQPLCRPFRANRCSDVSYTDSLDSASSDLSVTPSVFSDDQNDSPNTYSPGTSVGCPSPVMKQACKAVAPSIQHLPEYFEPPMPQHTEVVHEVTECQKCYGLKPHEAWEVVSMMKMESAALKGRIAELEVAQDSALDLLSGLTLEYKV